MTVTIWVVVEEDTHADLGVTLFSTQEKAIAFAEECACSIPRSRVWPEEDMELTDGMREDGWVYYFAYGENNSIIIMERELDKDYS